MNHSAAEPDPEPVGSRGYGPWSMHTNPQPFFNPIGSSSRLHRPYFVGFNPPAPEVDEDYEVSRYHRAILIDDLH